MWSVLNPFAPGRSWALALLLPLSLVAATSPPRFEVETRAGTGHPGYSGNGGPARQASLNNPFGVVEGPDGSIYFCEVGNHLIRKIGRDGTISTVAGSGQAGYSGDDGPALEARLNEPYEVRFDSQGRLVFVEMQNHLVRRVDMKTRKISTLAGNGKPGFSGDDGPARAATLKQPHSIQFDRDDNLYICDIGNNRIRIVEAKTGVIRTLAGTGQALDTPDGAPLKGTPLKGPRAIDFDREGNLWLALREGNAIYKIDLHAQKIFHQAGTGQQGFTGNGRPARHATLSGPKGLSIGPDGNIYFADTESHSIRRLNLQNQTIELVCGTGQKGDGPDGDGRQCKLARPHGIFVDGQGTIWVGDSENHRLRAIRPKSN